MATATILSAHSLEVPEDLRDLLALRETPTHYVVKTLSGASLLRLKSEIHFPWQLLRGVLDNGTDTTEERVRERKWELAHDQRKYIAE